MENVEVLIAFTNAVIDVLLYSGQCAPGFGGAL